jgi:hypothetical protein
MPTIGDWCSPDQSSQFMAQAPHFPQPARSRNSLARNGAGNLKQLDVPKPRAKATFASSVNSMVRYSCEAIELHFYCYAVACIEPVQVALFEVPGESTGKQRILSRMAPIGKATIQKQISLTAAVCSCQKVLVELQAASKCVCLCEPSELQLIRNHAQHGK